jgi:hypothetical protein
MMFPTTLVWPDMAWRAATLRWQVILARPGKAAPPVRPACRWPGYDTVKVKLTAERLQVLQTSKNFLVTYFQMSEVSKRKRSASDDEVAADFELAPRKNRPEWLNHGRQRLPIKTADGRLTKNPTKSVTAPRAPARDSDEDTASEQDAASADAAADATTTTGARGPPAPPSLTFAALVRMPAAARAERRAGLKSTIAALASVIVASPERSIAERPDREDTSSSDSRSSLLEL